MIKLGLYRPNSNYTEAKRKEDEKAFKMLEKLGLIKPKKTK